jgi:hypothetical protein
MFIACVLQSLIKQKVPLVRQIRIRDSFYGYFCDFSPF